MSTNYDPTLDPYATYGKVMNAPGNNAFAVTPSDTADFAAYPKAIVVTNGGNLVVLPLKAPDDGGHLITFTGVTTQFIPPFRVRRVMATGTTAAVVAIFD